MNGVLRKVTAQLGKLSIQKGPTPSNTIPKAAQASNDQTITHEWFWPRFGQWTQEKDIIITETGTSSYVSDSTQVNFGSHLFLLGYMGSTVCKGDAGNKPGSVGQYWLRNRVLSGSGTGCERSW